MTKELTTLFDELVDLVQRAVPQAQQTSKYGGILFTMKPDEKESQFCGVFSYKAHVQLSFGNGALLEDTTDIKLEGSGQYRRHINFKSSGSIDESVLKKLIIRSSKF